MINIQQIDVDTDGRARLDAAAMDLCHNDFLCPVCSKPMRLLTTIRRMPGEQTLVLQCKPCGLSTTKTVEGPGPRGDATH
jgi:transcription elongation factor Elf1